MASWQRQWLSVAAASHAAPGGQRRVHGSLTTPAYFLVLASPVCSMALLTRKCWTSHKPWVIARRGGQLLCNSVCGYYLAVRGTGACLWAARFCF